MSGTSTPTEQTSAESYESLDKTMTPGDQASLINKLMDRLRVLEENSQLTTQQLIESELKRNELQKQLATKNNNVAVTVLQSTASQQNTDANATPTNHVPSTMPTSTRDECLQAPNQPSITSSEQQPYFRPTSMPSSQVLFHPTTFNFMPTTTAINAPATYPYQHYHLNQQYAYNSPIPYSTPYGNTFSPTVHPPPPTYTTTRKLHDLPEFYGRPEDWPIFITTFHESTTVYGYSMIENNYRLRKCLKGSAYEEVESLLINAQNVPRVLEELENKYGQPELLIKSQLSKLKDIMPIPENHLERLVPFATKVRNLVLFLCNANAMQYLGSPSLLEELSSKMPLSKRIEWTSHAAHIKPFPTLEHFAAWIAPVAKIISKATTSVTTPTVSSAKPPAVQQRANTKHVFATNESSSAKKKLVCEECASTHTLSECSLYRQKSVNQRWNLVKEKRLCFSCLRKGHNIYNCKSKVQCKVDGCSNYHHITPHETKDEVNTEHLRTMQVRTVQPKSTKLLFKMLPIELVGTKNQIVRTFAFLDEGSSTTLINEKIVSQLGFQEKKQPLSLQWFGGKETQISSMAIQLGIRGVGKKRWININARSVPDLSLPMQTVNLSELHTKYRQLKNLPIEEYYDAEPTILIGLDNCHITANLRSVNCEQHVIASQTPLGWLVYGNTLELEATSTYQVAVVLHARIESVEEIVADYFTTENFGVFMPTRLPEAKDIERSRQIQEETTKRIGTRFETGLLWCCDNVELPDSHQMALNRLRSVEKKMQNNLEYGKAYVDAMMNYIAKGYARKLSPEEAAVRTPKTWYLPHFGVTNPNKPGKLRIVFDAAAEVNKISLNSMLLKGPDECQSLIKILLRFREKPVALCADIREMFLQVRIREQDQHAQRFLWREHQNSPIETWVMCAMIFGATCSPSSAQYVKNRNANEIAREQPQVVKAIVESHYVDDFVASFQDAQEAVEIGLAVKHTHKQAGFELRGFISNVPNVQHQLNDEHQPKATVNMKALDTVDKILGMYWDSHADEFVFKLQLHKVDPMIISGDKCPTKREFLSLVMSVYDPFGMLADFLIYGKVLLQELWRTGVQWDEEISQSIFERFAQWISKLKEVEQYHIDRCYSSLYCLDNYLELHIFVDASESAFAAVAYWRIASDSRTDISFVMGKTKCAPLKLLSVPRLELQAAVLGTRMRSAIMESHTRQPSRTIFWSDSKTVISWIKSDHRQYKAFVAHRVGEILETTHENDWRWLPTKFNAADKATRTPYPVSYQANNQWTLGPEFLMQPENYWPTSTPQPDEEKSFETEVEKRKCFLVMPASSIIKFSRFSSYLRLKRSMAWVLRFNNNMNFKWRGKGELIHSSELTANELKCAEIELCRIVQNEVYADEIAELQKGSSVSRSSSIYILNPYLNNYNLISVRGRLDYASCLPESARRPIILPKLHEFTDILVKWYHEVFYHQNDEVIVNEIRRKFWIPNLRAAVKSAKSRCQSCKNERASPKPPMMGQLPIDRVTPYIRPFSYTGLDYFGPLSVTIGRRREKRWAALFTCMTIRAIHIELVTDLSTDACIIAIRNFVNRRGVPIKIRSDRGTNFVGADKELRRVTVFDSNYIQRELSSKGIQWEFNSPANPSSGGCWERLIRSTKRVLAVTLNEKSPHVETLRSLLIEAENIINSRPLTHLPVSPDDPEPLTPNHFLLGTTNSTQTPMDEEANICSRKQYRISQQLKNSFWRRWMKEYLPTLTRRTKWFKPQKPIEEGDVVLICDENEPRSQWRRGIVAKTIVAKDGQIRIVDVRTSSGILRRPVSKLAVLDVLEVKPEDLHGRGNVAE